MKYKALNFILDDLNEEKKEIIIAQIADLGYEGFLETEKGFVAYIDSEEYSRETLEEILSNPFLGKIRLEEDFILEKNWNELWESNYEPVIINDKCLIRAPFHAVDKKYDIEVVIEPKMSFGTGHHETTSLVVEQMLTIDFSEKTVLDMGCGTGLLAILAAKLGAAKITAIDINEWAYENTIENATRNEVANLMVQQGDIHLIKNMKFDVIIANITRNVLIDHFEDYNQSLNAGGFLILSGFVKEDEILLLDKGVDFNLNHVCSKENRKWVSVLFNKK